MATLVVLFSFVESIRSTTMVASKTVPVEIDFEQIFSTFTQVLIRAKDVPEEFHQKALSQGILPETFIALFITDLNPFDLQLALKKARRKSLAAFIERKLPSSGMH